MSPCWRRRQSARQVAFRDGPRGGDAGGWGRLAHLDQDLRKHRIWELVMTLGFSRACCVGLVRQAVADTILNRDAWDIPGTRGWSGPAAEPA